MRTEKKPYVAVVDNHADFCGECNDFYTLADLARDAVRKTGITTNRKDPKCVRVKIFALEIKNASLVRRECQTINVQPPLEPMTPVEYDEECQDILRNVPEQFHVALQSMAYERGHSSGYEEVLGMLRDLVDSLLPAIKQYGKDARSMNPNRH